MKDAKGHGSEKRGMSAGAKQLQSLRQIRALETAHQHGIAKLASSLKAFAKDTSGVAEEGHGVLEMMSVPDIYEAVHKAGETYAHRYAEHADTINHIARTATHFFGGG